MELKTLDQVGRVADVDRARPQLTRHERLLRWAELLERAPKRALNTLFQTEYQSWEAREAMQVPNSAISVAYEDPVLRGEGMKDDSYGEAKRFFGLSDQELHEIVCYCHYGMTMMAESAAWRIRSAVARASHEAAPWGRVLRAFGY